MCVLGEGGGGVIRVLIADDHPVVRGGIAALVRAEADLELVGEATVKTHLQKVFAKLDVDDRTRAVTRAMELRLL